MAPSFLVLVRHGQSEHHVRRLTGGWTDTPLTELGHRQALLVAERLRRELGDARIQLFTSDLMRAGETCRHIARAFGVEPVSDPRLREFNNGDAINMTLDEAQERFPEGFAKSIFSTREPVFPNAETGAGFKERCGEFIESLDGEGGIPVLVTHGGTIMVMVAHWLGISAEDMARLSFAAHPTSITTLRLAGHDPMRFREVERLNDAAHLWGEEGYVSLGAVAG